jgi:hypothetical protein
MKSNEMDPEERMEEPTHDLSVIRLFQNAVNNGEREFSF